MDGAKKWFVIPVYQSNYDWKMENCKQLFDDLVKIIRSGCKSHFFGSIVSVYNPDGRNSEYLNIDSQQRLTTVSLLFLAMYNLIEKKVVTVRAGVLGYLSLLYFSHYHKHKKPPQYSNYGGFISIFIHSPKP